MLIEIKNNLIFCFKDMIKNSLHWFKASFLTNKKNFSSQLCCREMDLYTDLIENNTKNMKIAEEKQKYPEAINYCLNVIKLKQKLRGNDYKSQHKEFIQISNYYQFLNDYENSFQYLKKSLNSLKSHLNNNEKTQLSNEILNNLKFSCELIEILKEKEKEKEKAKELALEALEIIKLIDKQPLIDKYEVLLKKYCIIN